MLATMQQMVSVRRLRTTFARKIATALEEGVLLPWNLKNDPTQ